MSLVKKFNQTVTLSNHNQGVRSSGPIKTQANACIRPAPRAEKVAENYEWFAFVLFNRDSGKSLVANQILVTEEAEAQRGKTDGET